MRKFSLIIGITTTTSLIGAALIARALSCQSTADALPETRGWSASDRGPTRAAKRLADLGRDFDPRRWYGSNDFDLVVRRPVGKCPTDTRSNENQTDEYSTHSA